MATIRTTRRVGKIFQKTVVQRTERDMERGRTGSTGKRLPKLPGLRQMIFGRKEGKTDQSDWNRLGKGRMKSEGKKRVQNSIQRRRLGNESKNLHQKDKNKLY